MKISSVLFVLILVTGMLASAPVQALQVNCPDDMGVVEWKIDRYVCVPTTTTQAPTPSVSIAPPVIMQQPTPIIVQMVPPLFSIHNMTGWPYWWWAPGVYLGVGFYGPRYYGPYGIRIFGGHRHYHRR